MLLPPENWSFMKHYATSVGRSVSPCRGGHRAAAKINQILKGRNFVVLRDNIVVFVLVFIGRTRAFHWKWNLPPRTSHNRDRLPVPKVAPNIGMWPIVGRGLMEKVPSGLEKPFWRNLAKCQFLQISEFQMAISQPFMNRIWSCLYSNCAEFQGLSNGRGQKLVRLSTSEKMPKNYFRKGKIGKMTNFGANRFRLNLINLRGGSIGKI